MSVHDPRARLEVHDGVGLLTLTNPPANLLPPDLLEQFGAIARRVRNSAARVLVLTGSGSCFCAGADVHAFHQRETSWRLARDSAPPDGPAPTLVAWVARRRTLENQEAFGAFRTLGRPVIAAINGLCLGGGFELALSCHLRVASRRARLGFPEIDHGFFPIGGGTQLLPRLGRRGSAFELMLTGDTISADDAFRLGLVNRVVSPAALLQESLALARRIAAHPAPTVEALLEAVEPSSDLPLERTLTSAAVPVDILGRKVRASASGGWQNG